MMSNNTLLFAVAVGAGLWFRHMAKQADDYTAPSIIEEIESYMEPSIVPSDDFSAANRTAFLAMLRDSEGTSQYENPYAVIFGGRELDPVDFSDHPGNLGFTDWTHFASGGKDTFSTAAGAYQFLLPTWNRLKAKLGLPDFTPASQDTAALQLIREKGALALIDAGNVIAAANKLNTVWASLPGSPYGQPLHDEGFVLASYNKALNSLVG